MTTMNTNSAVTPETCPTCELMAKQVKRMETSVSLLVEDNNRLLNENRKLREYMARFQDAARAVLTELEDKNE